MNETDIQAIMIDNKTINQRIENSLNVIFADIDITAAQGRVLMYIANSPGKDIFAADLHKHLCISKPSVSALIKKLRKSGYISCTGCESDERYKNLTATNKGQTDSRAYIPSYEKYRAGGIPQLYRFRAE